MDELKLFKSNIKLIRKVMYINILKLLNFQKIAEVYFSSIKKIISRLEKIKVQINIFIFLMER